MLALTAWPDPDKLFAHLAAEVDACADDQHALSAEARAARLGQLTADLFVTEQEEARLVEAAEQAGVSVLPRPDLDPRALLALSATLPAARR
jgi:hypothetical protein